MKKPKVVVSGASQAELDQRERQFQENTALLREQQAQETGLLREQLGQQANIAEEQKRGLLAQLEAQGAVNAQTSQSNVLQLLAQQQAVGNAKVDERRVNQANTAQTASQATNVASEATKATSSRQNVLSQLNRRNLRYGKTK